MRLMNRTNMSTHLRSILPAVTTTAHLNFPIMLLKNHESTISPIRSHHQNSNMTVMNMNTVSSFNNISEVNTMRQFSSSGINAKRFIPRKAAVALTQNTRSLFKKLLQNRSQEGGGIILKLQHSTSGQPRLVFTLGFIEQNDVSETDEGVSLELLEDEETPKSPKDSMNDGLPKLFVHETSFMKVLGGTLDVEVTKDGNFIPKIRDKEGNLIEPNV